MLIEKRIFIDNIKYDTDYCSAGCKRIKKVRILSRKQQRSNKYFTTICPIYYLDEQVDPKILLRFHIIRFTLHNLLPKIIKQQSKNRKKKTKHE